MFILLISKIKKIFRNDGFIVKNKDFVKLCESLDSILLSKQSNFITNSISWLHLIKAHPIYLKNYNFLFIKNTFLIFIYMIIKFFINITKLIFFILISLFKPKFHINNCNHFKKNLDIFFISHLLNQKLINEQNDFYYGNLPKELNNKGLSSSILYFNYTKINHLKLIKINKITKENLPSFFFARNLGVTNNIMILSQQVCEFIRLLVNCIKKENNFDKLVYCFAAVETLSLSTYTNLTFSFQFKKILKKFNPKIIITTYEGYAFERLFYSIANDFNNKILSCGYQQSPYMQYQHAARRNIGLKYNPNYILSHGKNCSNQIINNKKNKGIKVLNIGSNKFTNTKDIIKNDKIKKQTFLIIPEAVVSECVFLFKFSLSCAYLHPEINFIWRCHPLININAILNKFFTKNLPSNIIISKNNTSIDDDLKICQFAIYRGTSLIIQACANGIFPIYLKKLNELSINPLYEMDKHIENFESVECFNEFINKININLLSKDMSFKEIINYCRNYYSRLDYKPIFSLVSKKLIK